MLNVFIQTLQVALAGVLLEEYYDIRSYGVGTAMMNRNTTL